jgi:uncharacterized membrane protein YfcA
MILVDVAFFGSIFVIIGVLAGLMAGALGIGGGLIVVPSLVIFFENYPLVPPDSIMRIASGSSLAIMLFTSLASLKMHARLGEILWPLYYRLWPGIVVGVILGVVLSLFISTATLKIIYGIFLVLMAVKMLLDRNKIHDAGFPRPWINHLINGTSGVQSGLFGVGNGLIIIPYLTYCGVPPRKIAPVTNVCSLTTAFIGALGFIFAGLDSMSQVNYTLGYIYWPAVLGIAVLSSFFAPLGAKLNYILPVSYLKNVFIVILILTAIKML